MLHPRPACDVIRDQRESIPTISEVRHGSAAPCSWLCKKDEVNRRGAEPRASDAKPQSSTIRRHVSAVARVNDARRERDRAITAARDVLRTLDNAHVSRQDHPRRNTGDKRGRPNANVGGLYEKDGRIIRDDRVGGCLRAGVEQGGRRYRLESYDCASHWRGHGSRGATSRDSPV